MNDAEWQEWFLGQFTKNSTRRWRVHQGDGGACYKECRSCHRLLPTDAFYPHTGGRDGLRSRCKSCMLQIQLARYSKNPDEMRERARQYRRQHIDKARSTSREWHRTHREALLVRGARWRETNRVRVRERARICAARYRVECPDKVRARNAARAARRYGRTTTVGSERVDPVEIFERDKWHCKLCKCKTPRELQGSLAPSAPSLDHIIPLVLGGPHTRRNLQCLCRTCNIKKRHNYEGQLAFA